MLINKIKIKNKKRGIKMLKLTKWKIYLTAMITLVLGFTLIWSCSNNSTTSTTVGKLTVSLDTNIVDSDSAWVQGPITSAVLYAFPGNSLKAASVSNGVATFDLTGIGAGNYYLIINNLTDLREPTYIADPSQDERVYVGRRLRQSIVLTGSGDTLCKIKTDPEADGENSIVAFSDGHKLNRWAWNVVYYKLGYTETHHLDDGTALVAKHMFTSDALIQHHYWDALGGNTVNDSLANHGQQPSWGLGSNPGDRGIDSAKTVQLCGTNIPGKPSCHLNFWVKPPSYSQISDTNGFCFTCHYGFQGDGGWQDQFPHGFLDPTK